MEKRFRFGTQSERCALYENGSIFQLFETAGEKIHCRFFIITHGGSHAIISSDYLSRVKMNLYPNFINYATLWRLQENCASYVVFFDFMAKSGFF